MAIEPIPLSEREKQTQKILDFAQDMYDDEDYNKYIWAVAKSSDGGKTFKMTAGRLPTGMSLTCKPDNEIAPISMSQHIIIEPMAYEIKAISASEWLPENHPVILLRMQHEEGNPKEAWKAPPGKESYTLTFDLGEERIVGCVEFWPVTKGKYEIRIGVSASGPTDFDHVRVIKIENFGPATNIPLDSLVRARYVQIVTTCNEVKQVRILSMSENASQDDKVGLSHEFYNQDITNKRLKR